MSQQVAGHDALRLVLHIGDGKTGSTSIQATLRRQPRRLRNRGYLYLGTMLDLAPEPQFAWQSPSAAPAFLRLERAAADSQLLQVMRSLLPYARQEGLHTLIWSNEVFFSHAQNLYTTLDWLLAEGVKLEIVAYIRRHDAWMRSAYVQWGIKHKTYTGPVRSFREWSRSRSRKRFSPALLRFEARYPGCVRVRNLDAVGDAVADFLALVGLADAEIRQVSRNTMPTTAELLLRVLVDAQVPGTARVRRYDQLLGRDLVDDASSQAYLARFLPTEAELAEIRDQASADRAALDQILAASGQPPVDVTPLPSKPVTVDESSLLLMLCDIVVRQALRIERLEKHCGARGSMGVTDDTEIGPE